MWQSKVYSPQEHYAWVRERYGMEPDTMGQYLLDGGDFVTDFIKRCRHHDQIAFIGLRLNDQHAKDFIDSRRLDSRARWWLPLPFGRFYEEHPEYRLGPDLNDSSQRVHNWIHEETREFKFRLIEELCQNYDLDGIELDFIRHPASSRAGRPPGKSAVILSPVLFHACATLWTEPRGAGGTAGSVYASPASCASTMLSVST